MKNDKPFIFFVIVILSILVSFNFLALLLIDAVAPNGYHLWGFFPIDIFGGLIMIGLTLLLAMISKRNLFQTLKLFVFLLFSIPLFSDTAFTLLNGNLHEIQSHILVYRFPAYLYSSFAIILFLGGLTLYAVQKWHKLMLYFLPLIFYVDYGLCFFIPLEPEFLLHYLLIEISVIALILVGSLLLKLNEDKLGKLEEP